MRPAFKVCAATLCAALVAAVPAFAGCNSAPYVTSISKTGRDGQNEVYTITYSDGSTSTINVPAADGTAYADGLYEKYIEETGEDISYSEFLEKFLTLNTDDTSKVTNLCLLSSMKIYAQFVESYEVGGFFNPQIYYDHAIYTGGAVIYSMDEGAGGYTYIVTNYHVTYDSKAVPQLNNGSKLPVKIYGYLYGSEGAPAAVRDENGNVTADENGYTSYDGGEYAIDLEYVGGSIDNDIAVLRAKTADIKAVNEDACEVTIADEYHVGETAIAIGNPDDGGISVTRGVISTVNEDILLDIDGDNNYTAYRSVRIDTALYQGNSGGGLFNCEGELIGITNAGSGQEENINYAVPLEVVTGVANNIIYYANDGDENTVDGYDVTFGFTTSTSGSRYVYDVELGYGEVMENITVEEVSAGSLAEQMGLKSGDVLKAIVVNGKQTDLLRSYDISDMSFTLRPDDEIAFVVERDGEQLALTSHTLSFEDLTPID